MVKLNQKLCLRGNWRWRLLCVLLFAPALVMVANPPSGRKTANEAAQQPDKRISGAVYDVNNAPLQGVNVIITGTATGTVTNADGRFTINVPAGALLEFSYIGYVKQTVAAEDNLRITLEETAEELEEVVVVGYGSVKKSDLTGSVTSVTPRSFLDQPASSVNSVLVGRAPGVVVRRANGAPGEGSTIRIRGVNSILGSNDPLIVVDGNYSGMPNPYDIESIEILKDASATAIYGSRGANGVIIVTTKRGSSESKNEVKVYSNVSFDQMPKKWRYDMMDALEYVEFANEMNVINGLEPIYSQEVVDRVRQEGGKGTDWQSELFRLGVSQNHKVVFTGKVNKMKYYVSPAFSQMDGILINTSSKGYSVNMKLDAELNNRVSYQIEGNLGHSETLNPNLGRGTDHTGLPLYAALVWSPIANVYNDDGSFMTMDPLAARNLNPVLLTSRKNTNYSNSGSAVGNIKVKILEGFYFDGKASMSFGASGSRNYTPKEMSAGLTNVSQSSSESKSWLLSAYLTYSKTVAENHNFSAMIGFEETQSESHSFNANANDLMIPEVGWDNMDLGRVKNIGSGYSNSAMRSYFARATYNYKSRYYFTGTYRADGSSKFQGKNQFSYFPSFALAWRLSEENFLKDLDIFQNLKIRGSWGITGSQAIGAYATYAPMTGTTYCWGTTQPYSGYRPGVQANPNLQWEETTSFDAGLDVTVLDGKLSVTIDYYHKQTDRLLSRTTVPIYNGGGSFYTNIGSIENQGIELNLNYLIFENKDWSYDVNLNGARNRNKVLDIGEHDRLWGGSSVAGAMPTSPFIILPGQPIGTIYGYHYLGLWQVGEVKEAEKYKQVPGEYRYEDLNGNNEYDAGDYKIIGCASPKFTWGFNNHLSWKNWDMNILIEGLFGRDILNLSYLCMNNMFDQAMTIKGRAGKDRWTPDNPDAEFAKITETNVVKSNSDQWIQDGSYVKVRNLSLAYRFDRKLLKHFDARISASAQNVFRFTKYKGYDPEVSSAGGSDTDAGLDWFAYPNPRSYTVSVSLNF